MNLTDPIAVAIEDGGTINAERRDDAVRFTVLDRFDMVRLVIDATGEQAMGLLAALKRIQADHFTEQAAEAIAEVAAPRVLHKGDAVQIVSCGNHVAGHAGLVGKYARYDGESWVVDIHKDKSNVFGICFASEVRVIDRRVAVQS